MLAGWPFPNMSGLATHEMAAAVCPITQEIMEDPVVCADGHSYERSAIEKWLQARQTSPCTNAPLPHKNLVPNHALRNLIAEARGVRRPTTIEQHALVATPCKVCLLYTSPSPRDRQKSRMPSSA